MDKKYLQGLKTILSVLVITLSTFVSTAWACGTDGDCSISTCDDTGKCTGIDEATGEKGTCSFPLNVKWSGFPVTRYTIQVVPKCTL